MLLARQAPIWPNEERLKVGRKMPASQRVICILISADTMAPVCGCVRGSGIRWLKAIGGGHVLRAPPLVRRRRRRNQNRAAAAMVCTQFKSLILVPLNDGLPRCVGGPDFRRKPRGAAHRASDAFSGGILFANLSDLRPTMSRYLSDGEFREQVAHAST